MLFFYSGFLHFLGALEEGVQIFFRPYWMNGAKKWKVYSGVLSTHCYEKAELVVDETALQSGWVLAWEWGFPTWDSQPLRCFGASRLSSLSLMCKMRGLDSWSQSPYNLCAEGRTYEPPFARHSEVVFCPIPNSSPVLDIYSAWRRTGCNKGNFHWRSKL